jgi:DNA polymerase III epsilon subunit-like protein
MKNNIYTQYNPKMPIVICFDTETTGMPPPSTNPKFKTEGFFNDKRVPAELWPRIVQLSFIQYDTDREMVIQHYDQIIKMKQGVKIPRSSTNIHGITDEMSKNKGIDIREAMMYFMKAYYDSEVTIGHNVQFDLNVVCAELTILMRDPTTTPEQKKSFEYLISSLMGKKRPKFCTMRESKDVCQLPKHQYNPVSDEIMIDEKGYFKIDESLDEMGKRKTRHSNLENTHKILFHEKPNGQLHNALVDVAVCLRVYMKLYKNVDICDASHHPNNSFVYNLIKPVQILSNELPARVGDDPKTFEIRRMNDFTFNKKFKTDEELDHRESKTAPRVSRSKTRSYRRRNTKSASPLKRKSNKTKRERNSY